MVMIDLMLSRSHSSGLYSTFGFLVLCGLPVNCSDDGSEDGVGVGNKVSDLNGGDLTGLLGDGLGVPDVCGLDGVGLATGVLSGIQGSNSGMPIGSSVLDWGWWLTV